MKQNQFFHTMSSDALSQAHRSDQIRHLYKAAPFAYCGTIVGSLILVVSLHLSGKASTKPLLTVVVLTLLTGVARGVLSWFFARSTPEQRCRAHWLYWFQISVFVSGCGWGVFGALMPTIHSVPHQMLLEISLMAVLTLGLMSYSIHFPSFVSFMMPLMIGAVVGQLNVSDSEWSHFLVGLSICYMATAWVFARVLSTSLNNALILQHQNAALAATLGKKSAQAEEANIAKSRFLAAASHDLRQPVHALGLFLAQLRRMDLPLEVRPTMMDMEDCLAATNNLFTSILKVCQLDAGIIEPVRSPLAVAPFGRRIAVEHEVMSRVKGLDFRVYLSSELNYVFVDTDEQLLERILRNLLQNALRYTERGGVLLALRLRGTSVIIDVFDTGFGIAENHLDDIFQEFVQLAPRLDQRQQGLGLGLSIVRRLCTLLQHDITVRSRPGRGTRFRIKVSRIDPPTLTSSAVKNSVQGYEVSLSGRFIVVLDDNPMIVRALMSLLQSWGAQVYGDHTLDLLLAASVNFERRPDLIISDFHLHTNQARDGDLSNGISAVAQLRDEFSHDIPAMLITGDTDIRQLRQAYSSGLLVLHKPLQSSELVRHLATLFDHQPAARANSTA